jgi:maltokinase
VNRLVEELPTLLPEWLTHQRWFGAKGRPVRSVAVAAVTPLITEGDPLLDHVLLRVGFDSHNGGGEHYYQLLVGRSAAPRGELEHVTFGAVDGLVAYDGLWDLRVTEWLLTALREGRTIGALRFVPEPDAKIAERGAGRVLGVEQSNTSVSWGERSILKLFRRVLPGLNPDLELHRALRSVGSGEVAALQGAVEGTLDGEPLTLAMLQDFAANSADGWSMALASVRDLLAEADLRADEVGGDFAGEASRLGETVAVVHDELRRALGETSRDARELAAGLARAAGLHGRRGAVARAVRRRIRATYDAGGRARAGMPTQRVHGDLHLGQTLRTPRAGC